MAKQLNVNLAFSADTSQARAQIQELQNALNNIHKAPAREDAIFNGKNIREASQAALELSQHLQKAVNVDTGKLDLARFSSSLKASGKTLDSYYETLLRIGPEGQQAFLGLATAIAQAEAPVVRVNKQLSEMWTTMKNTARWQLSSSVLHGFMGTLQSAYGYAQDLNESLNNIRIVSGQSTDQMAKFAKEANKSAKALSATTTEYTNASLIYYQQGLSEQEVKERTDITIKMANAAGVSAEHVSDQLTAVWNNFAKGGENLEYYADVMTALGAATASSTDEIAAGLEKFAAIADTVGLSYEYSTAALATITANTRQSADVVGNALKTLFARIQGLSLGETLEDGVDLNKYSSALAAVGVSVLDTNGQLREMDDILDDLAAKWDTIGKAEQTALAQTVAGVRQYTQLVALMENWDDMERNLDVAYNSTGTLQAQADIYAESWEAASDRVRAAAEGIFDSLINDEFFIDLLNGFEKVLTGVEGLIDGFGGLKGIASITGAILLKQFSKELPASFRNIRENFMVYTGKGDVLMDEMQSKSTKKINEIMGRKDLPENFKAQLAQQQRLTLMQNKLLKNSKNMSNEEIQSYQAEMDMVRVMSEAQVDLVKQKEEAEKKTLKSKKEISKQIIDEDEKVQKARRILAIRQEQEERQRREETLRAQKEEIEKELGQEKYKAKKKKQLSPEIQTEKRKKIEEKKGVSENIKEEVVAQQRLKAEELQLLSDLGKSEIDASEENFLKEFTDEKRTKIKGLLEQVETTTKKAKSLSFTKDTFGEDKDLKAIQDKEERKKAIETAKEKARIQSARLTKQFADEEGNITDLDVKNIVKQLDAIAAEASEAEVNIESLQEKINALGETGGRNIINETKTAAEQAAQNLEKAFGEDEEKRQKAEDFVKKVENQVDLENRQTEGAVRLDQDYQASPTHKIKPEEVFGDFSAYAMSTAAAIESTKSFVSAVTEGGSALEIIGSAAAMAATGFETYQMAAQLATSASSLLGISVSTLMPWLLAIAAIVGIVAVAYDYFAGAQDRAKSAIADATNSAQEESSKLEGITSELKSIEQEIANIKALGTLDIVEQSELDALERRKTLLEAQADAQKAIADAALETQGETIAENWNNAHRSGPGNLNQSGLKEVDSVKYRGEEFEDTNQPWLLKKLGIKDYSATGQLSDEEYRKEIEKKYGKDENGNYKNKTEYDKHIALYEASVEETRKKKLVENADEVNAVLDDFAAMLESFMADNKLDEDEKEALRNAQSEVEEAQKLTYGEEGYQEKVVGKFIADNLSQITAEGLREGVMSGDFSSMFSEDDLLKAGIEGASVNDLFNTLKVGASDGISFEEIQSMSSDDWSILLANFETIAQQIEDGILPDDFIDYLRNDVDRRTVEEKRAGADSVGDSKAQALGLDLESFQAYRDLLYETNEKLKENPQLLNEVAVAHERQLRGQESLNQITEDYGQALKKASDYAKKNGNLLGLDSKTTKDLGTSIKDIRNSLTDIFDVSDDVVENLTDDEIVKNWDLLQGIMKGNKDSYNEYQKLLTKKSLAKALGIEDIENLPESISSSIDKLADLEGFNIGDKISLESDIGKEINALASEVANAIMSQTGDADDAIQAYNNVLSQLGKAKLDPTQFDVVTKTILSEVPPDIAAQVYPNAVPDEAGGLKYDVKYVKGQGQMYEYQVQQIVPKGDTAFTEKEGGTVNKAPGGGGGGGGGSKAPEKPKDYNKERYYTLTNQLEDIQKEYDEISAAAERAFGKDKLDLIDQQIAKTEEQIEKQKELVAAVEANIPGDQKNLIDSYNKLFNGAGPQFQFDERGIISNFDEIQDYIWEQYQIAEAEDNKELKADLDAWMALYEETRDKLNDEQAKLKELERQQLDLALQKIEYEIELRVELAKDELDFLDYQLSKIEDDAFKAAEAIANLNKQMSELGDTSDANLAGITKILQNKGLSDEEINAFLSGDTSVLEGKGLEEAEVEALRGYRDGLIDTNEQFQKLRENVEEQLSEVFDAWQEKLQEGVDKVQHFGSVLEAYGNIIDIVGEKTLGITDDFLKDLSDKVVDNAVDNLKAVRSQYEATQKTLAEAQAHLDSAIAQGDEDMIKYWTEQVRTISQEADDLSEEVLGAWEEALNKVVEVFEAAVETAVEKFNDAIYELGGLEGLSADFEKQQELADMYLEDYQKIYELSKLNRDITKSMDDMESISGKRKLRDLQKEINDLQASGVELSEYDLEYLQKKYDLRMAEIALEEAQNAKDTVRLQKDNEGNYSYVYTANTDAVDEAQQKYEDALYSMQDLSSNYIDEMSSMIIDASQQMSEELAAIRRQDYETEEEYQEALRRVEDYWMERIGRQKNELDKAVNNNKTLYDEDWTNYHNATGYKISDTDKFVTDFSDSMLSALMGVESSGALMNIISNATAGLIEDLLEASKEFGRRTEEIMNEAGTSVKDFAGDVDEASKNIADASKKAADSVGQMGDDMIEDFNNVADSIHDFQIRYIEEIQPIIDANERVVQSLNDIIESAAGLDGLSIGMKDGRYVIEIPSGEQGETSNPPASASMDTGGYTGDWSDNKGRLAWVHKRELMLNQEDTLNVLKAVELTKMMLQTIELNAQQAASGFGMLNATGLPQEEVQTLQQEVHITAEFPNVQDSNEIKDAFNTLINTASQYANRK